MSCCDSLSNHSLDRLHMPSFVHSLCIPQPLKEPARQDLLGSKFPGHATSCINRSKSLSSLLAVALPYLHSLIWYQKSTRSTRLRLVQQCTPCKQAGCQPYSGQATCKNSFIIEAASRFLRFGLLYCTIVRIHRLDCHSSYSTVCLAVE